MAAVRVDESYMETQHIRPEEDWNYAHNLAYLVAACAEAGRYQEGLEWAKKLRDMPSPTGMTAARFVVWAGGSVARLRIRFSDWQAVGDEVVEFGRDPASASPVAKAYAEGLKLYAQGMAAVEQNDATQAARQSESLDALLWRLEASHPKKKEDKDEEKNAENPDQILNLLGTMSLDLRANLKSMGGARDEALDLFEKASEKEKDLGYSEPPQYFRPEQESMGFAYLRARDYEKARAAFTQALNVRPKSGHALYGIAQSYALAGDTKKAIQAYKDFLMAWQHADATLPQIMQAKAWLAAHDH